MKGRGAINGLKQEPNEEKAGKDHAECALRTKRQALVSGASCLSRVCLHEAWTTGAYVPLMFPSRASRASSHHRCLPFIEPIKPWLREAPWTKRWPFSIQTEQGTAPSASLEYLST